MKTVTRELKRNVDVIVGLQHGDEGKGKIINELCCDYDINVRFNGGANSGHTMYDRNGNKVVMNVLPSGMINKNITGVITQGVVINPFAFIEETERVEKSVIDLYERLYISADAHLTIPSHILIDYFTEAHRQKGGTQKIGSTNRGNTPTYVDRVARRGLRVSDIKRENFSELYMALVNSHIDYIKGMFGISEHEIYNTKIGELSLKDYEHQWHDAVIKMGMKFKVCNTVSLLHKFISAGASILVEGAQGCMLDVEYGTYPYVTSSSVTASAAFAQTGIPVQCVNKIFGVFKPYVTRVGSGFFPTQIVAEPYMKSLEHIATLGKEFGSVTGRARKLGWLDMPQLKYACMINGVTDLIMMKADMLSELPTEVLVCDSYSYGNSIPHKHDIYKGEEDFICANYKQFPKVGVLFPTLSDELYNLIEYIDKYMEDVITKPTVSIVSHSPTYVSTAIVS